MSASKRASAIADALREVYGSGSMVSALADHLDSKWDEWRAGGGSAARRGFDDALYLEIWLWFSGGDTAQFAAGKVIEAVGDSNG